MSRDRAYTRWMLSVTVGPLIAIDVPVVFAFMVVSWLLGCAVTAYIGWRWHVRQSVREAFRTLEFLSLISARRPISGADLWLALDPMRRAERELRRRDMERADADRAADDARHHADDDTPPR